MGSPRYDNTLTVGIPLNNSVDGVTGSQLAAALIFGVNGFGQIRPAPTTISGSTYKTPLDRCLLHRQLNAKRV